MGSAVVFGVLLLFLLLILAGMLRGLDWEALSRSEGGLLSRSGVLAAVGGGFLIGLAYGLFVGSQSGTATWMWVSRGVIDGLVVACAGAFYLGYQQRRMMRDSLPTERTVSGGEPASGPAEERVDTVAGANAEVAGSNPAVDEPESALAASETPEDVGGDTVS